MNSSYGIKRRYMENRNYSDFMRKWMDIDTEVENNSFCSTDQIIETSTFYNRSIKVTTIIKSGGCTGDTEIFYNKEKEKY